MIDASDDAPAEPDSDVRDAAPIDVSMSPADAPGDADAAVDPCGPPVPSSTAPFGTSVGRSFRPLTLEACDGSGPYAFYGENQWCEPGHRLTLLSIVAAWCVPCQMQTAALTSVVTEPYRTRGVRVVQVVVDGSVRGGGATLSDCTNWVSAHGLTNIELLDSGGAETGRYFPSGSLPSTLIVDDEGVIRFYEDGLAVSLSAITAELDRLLAEP